MALTGAKQQSDTEPESEPREPTSAHPSPALTGRSLELGGLKAVACPIGAWSAIIHMYLHMNHGSGGAIRQKRARARNVAL